MISKNIAFSISAIKGIMYFVPRETLLTFCYALIQPQQRGLW